MSGRTAERSGRNASLARNRGRLALSRRADPEDGGGGPRAAWGWESEQRASGPALAVGGPAGGQHSRRHLLGAAPAELKADVRGADGRAERLAVLPAGDQGDVRARRAALVAALVAAAADRRRIRPAGRVVDAGPKLGSREMTRNAPLPSWRPVYGRKLPTARARPDARRPRPAYGVSTRPFRGYYAIPAQEGGPPGGSVRGGPLARGRAVRQGLRSEGRP